MIEPLPKLRGQQSSLEQRPEIAVADIVTFAHLIASLGVLDASKASRTELIQRQEAGTVGQRVGLALVETGIISGEEPGDLVEELMRDLMRDSRSDSLDQPAEEVEIQRMRIVRRNHPVAIAEIPFALLGGGQLGRHDERRDGIRVDPGQSPFGGLNRESVRKNFRPGISRLERGLPIKHRAEAGDGIGPLVGHEVHGGDAAPYGGQFVPGHRDIGFGGQHDGGCIGHGHERAGALRVHRGKDIREPADQFWRRPEDGERKAADSDAVDRRDDRRRSAGSTTGGEGDRSLIAASRIVTI